MSPETPTRAPVELDDALARVLDCPLNEPAWAEAAREGFAAMTPPPALDDFSAQRPLPRLSAVFDAAFYLEQNPDVAGAGMEPYRHFIEHGIVEGRDPHPLVDLGHVRSRRGEDTLDAAALAAALADPGIGPHPQFDPAAYLENNPDVREAGLPALQHYIRHGAEEGRRPNADFDPDWYCERYLAPGAGRYEAFVHYIRVGQARGNAPSREVIGPDEGGARAGAVAVEHVAEAAESTTEAGGGVAFEGFLDAVHGRAAHGWAWTPGEPGRALQIEILEDDHVVGRGVADMFRDDLEAHGYGNGCHAFRVRLSRELDDGQGHRLQARIAGTGHVLHGEASYLAEPAPRGEHDPIAGRDAGAAARHIAAGMSPSDGRAFLEAECRARLLVETGEFDAALVAIGGVEENFPDTPLLALHAADARFGLGQPDMAIVQCRRAVELAPEGALAATSQLYLGNASRLLGQWREAEAAYTQALVHDPGLAAARRRLAEVADRNELIEARRSLAGGDAAAALQRLVPQLIRHPGDDGLQRLVHTAMVLRGDPALKLDPDGNRALAAVRLLRSVVDHLRARGGAA